MKYDYKKVITDNKTINDHTISAFVEANEKYPNVRILIELASTKYLSSELLKKLPKGILIRVAGGYDAERIKRRGNLTFSNGETGSYYDEAVIYTRNELIKIVEEIEKIEKGYHESWSDIQKAMYTYHKLKTEIMYDPQYENKPSAEIRSLRGLVTKETVCAGYSLIFKEIMDRNGIDCEYVEGYTNKDGTGAHAWNILNIDSKKYPIDLTEDNANFRAGKLNTINGIPKSIESFAEYHIPYEGEKTANYHETLSKMDQNVIDLIFEQITKSGEYNKTTYYGTRNDGTKFMAIQIGSAETPDNDYYRYYYADIKEDETEVNPIILYSESNLTALFYGKLHGKPVPENYENTVNNILFSLDNIQDSINKRTYYIGKVSKETIDNKIDFVTSYKEIEKPEDISKIFSLPTKKFTRSDDTYFIAQQISPYTYDINGKSVIRYDIFEYNKETKRLKRNTVFTEKNFFKDYRQSMIDNFFSRERIDTISEKLGGYLGYFNEQEEIKYNETLLAYFHPQERIDIIETEAKHR